MGEHRGFLVQPRGKRFLARAWNPSSKGYVSKTFDKEGEAKDWARLKNAAFLTVPVAKPKDSTRVLADKYLADLKRRGREESHLRDVRYVLGLFCAEVRAPDEEAIDKTRAWLESLETLAPPTRNRYAVTVKAMCRWAVRNKHLLSNPLDALEMESEPDTLKEQFSIDELRTMALAFGDPYHKRFCLEFYAGLRSDEAAHLPGDRLDFTGKVIHIRLGAYRLKRRKERIVGLQDELAAIMWEHRLSPATIAPKTQASAWREFVAFLDRLGIPKRGRSPHSLRHCYAGMMTATGVPSITVQGYMGHSSAQTTAGYAKLAARYVAAVQGWPMGQFQLLVGASSPLPTPHVRQASA